MSVNKPVVVLECVRGRRAVQYVKGWATDLKVHMAFTTKVEEAMTFPDHKAANDFVGDVWKYDRSRLGNCRAVVR